MKKERKKKHKKFAYLSTLLHGHIHTRGLVGDVALFLSIAHTQQKMQSLSRCHTFIIIMFYHRFMLLCLFLFIRLHKKKKQENEFHFSVFLYLNKYDDILFEMWQTCIFSLVRGQQTNKMAVNFKRETALSPRDCLFVLPIKFHFVGDNLYWKPHKSNIGKLNGIWNADHFSVDAKCLVFSFAISCDDQFYLLYLSLFNSRSKFEIAEQ